MRVVLQRVTRATVRVDGATVGSVEAGLVALVGVAAGDAEHDAVALARKTGRLRVFAGEGNAPARSVAEAGGGVLVVSQFTLLADTSRGNRPSWSAAAPPAQAEPLVDAYARELEACGVTVACGVFGAHMEVELVNDGPVTILLDSRD